MSYSAVETSRHLHRLLQAGEITPHIFVVGDTLLWRCGRPSRNAACISYERLAQLAGVSRSMVAEAVQRLKELGLLSWEKTRIRIRWGWGVASRQWRNVYHWIARPRPVFTESTRRTTDSKQEKKQKRRSEMALNPVRSPAEQVAELGGNGSRELLDERRRRFDLGLVPIQQGSPKPVGDLLRARREAMRATWEANRDANRANRKVSPRTKS